MDTKYYSQEVVVCIWKDSNPLGLKGLGPKIPGHTSLKVKGTGIKNTYISWFPEHPTHSKDEICFGRKVEAYYKDGNAELGSKTKAGLEYYIEHKHEAIHAIDKCYAKIKDIKRKQREKISEIRREYKHDTNLMLQKCKDAEKEFLDQINSQKGKIKDHNLKLKDATSHKVYFKAKADKARKNLDGIKRSIQMEKNRLKSKREKNSAFLILLQKKEMQTAIDLYNSVYWYNKDTIKPRINQKIKDIEEELDLVAVTSADIKIYLPVQGSIRRADGAKMNFGLDGKAITDWWKDFHTKDNKELYSMLDKDKNCSGIVLQALEKGKATNVAKKPIISSPRLVLT